MGKIYISDTGNKRILLYSTNGAFIAQFGTAGTGVGELDEPVGIAVWHDQLLAVADTWNQRVQIFDVGGEAPSFAVVGSFDIAGWYSQSLEQSLKKYDFTAIMAMPYMEQAPDAKQFYQNLVKRVNQQPQGMKKAVFELQAVNWRTSEKIPTTEMTDTIKSLYQQGVLHVGYYPDDPIQGHPDPEEMRKVFDSKSYRLIP